MAEKEEQKLEIRKMTKRDEQLLFNIALRAFSADAEKYGSYPPLLDLLKKRFSLPLLFGHVLLVEGTIIGGLFALPFIGKGELGAIFLDPAYWGKDYGGQALKALEELYPKVREWRLKTPAESPALHRFYEKHGYKEVARKTDRTSGIGCIVYEKTIK